MSGNWNRGDGQKWGWECRVGMGMGGNGNGNDSMRVGKQWEQETPLLRNAYSLDRVVAVRWPASYGTPRTLSGIFWRERGTRDWKPSRSWTYRSRVNRTTSSTTRLRRLCSGGGSIHRALSVQLLALSACTLHYITLETIYSGLSKSNFKDHYGDSAK